MYFILSKNKFTISPIQENIPDIMDGVADSAEALASGNLGLALSKFSIAAFRAVLPSKEDGSLAWELIERSALSAWDKFISRFPNENWSKIKFKKEVCTKLLVPDMSYKIDADFFYHPGDSKISEDILNLLVELLKVLIDDEQDLIISELKKVWQRYFSSAVEHQYVDQIDQFKPLFQKLKAPMAKYNKHLKEKYLYEDKILDFKKECVFGEENIFIDDIYISLYARCQDDIWFSYQLPDFSADIDLDQFLHEWSTLPATPVNNSRIERSWYETTMEIALSKKRVCIIHGEPGSGKSTVLKNLAVYLILESVETVFIRLKDVSFNGNTGCCRKLIKYIKEKFPWVNLSHNHETQKVNTVILLDGLDEISGEVWTFAHNLIKELDSHSWPDHIRIILTGRTQLINTSEQLLNQTRIYQICGLKHLQPKCFWEKLKNVFSLSLEFSEVYDKPYFRELMDKPLLVFLVAWCHKYAASSVLEIKDTTELYNTIIECLYSRRHGDDEVHFFAGFGEYREVLDILAYVAQKNNNNDARISDVYKYAEQCQKSELVNKWINRELLTNSKLLLAFFGTANKKTMVLSFYHRSFVEFLTIEHITNQLLYLSNFDNQRERVSFLNQIFDDYHLFDTNDDNVLSFWIGKLRHLDQSKSRELFDHLVKSMVYAIISCNEEELAETARENVIGATLKLFEYLKTARHSMKFMIPGTIQKSWYFAQKEIPTLIFESSMKLKCCDFSEAKLDDIIASGSMSIDRCYFNSTIIREFIINGNTNKFLNAQFYYSKIERLSLWNTDISRCHFDGSVIKNCKFPFCLISDSTFRHAELKGADFRNTSLDNIDFSFADLSNALFDRNTNLRNCVLSNTILNGVKMSCFILDDVKIQEMLKQANLDGADWSNVDADVRFKIENQVNNNHLV